MVLLLAEEFVKPCFQRLPDIPEIAVTEVEHKFFHRIAHLLHRMVPPSGCGKTGAARLQRVGFPSTQTAYTLCSGEGMGHGDKFQ